MGAYVSKSIFSQDEGGVRIFVINNLLTDIDYNILIGVKMKNVLSGKNVEFLKRITNNEGEISVVSFSGFANPGHIHLSNKRMDIRMTIETEEESRISVAFQCFSGRDMQRHEFMLQTDPVITDEKRDEIRGELCMDLLQPIDPDFREAYVLEYWQYSDHRKGVSGYRSDLESYWTADQRPERAITCEPEQVTEILEFLLNSAIRWNERDSQTFLGR